ncbi:MAG: MFS transporter, partial [Chitinophagaceae bacterium]
FIPAVFIAILADFIGRKPFILLSTFLLIACSIATANAGSITSFIVFQFLAFMFISAETSVAVVMIIEEAKNNMRGFAVSLLSGLSAVGTGFAAVVYGINAYMDLPFQYNYYYGILPLLIILVLRSRLKETQLFNHAVQDTVKQSLKDKIRERFSLLKSRSGNLLMVCLVTLFYDACVAPAYILASKFLQESHAFTPYQVSAIIVISGSVATLGAIGIGYVSDVRGRRKILLALMLATIASVAIFYNTRDIGLYIAWFVFIFVSSSAASLIMTIGTELFPTATRASAAGIRGMFSAAGGALGLVLEGELIRKFKTHNISIALLTVLIVVSAVLVYWKLPETAKKELEQ